MTGLQISQDGRPLITVNKLFFFSVRTFIFSKKLNSVKHGERTQRTSDKIDNYGTTYFYVM